MTKKEVLRVKGDIKQIYSKLSKTYALIEEKFEKDIRKKALKLLNIQEGEVVLEIGFGTGCTLIDMSDSVGESGEIHGIDLTPDMIRIAKERLHKKGLLSKIKLKEGDARELPYEDQMFDVVYLASTLELFDTPEIPLVLKEIKRVLKLSGRLGIVSIPKEGHENSFFLKMYEWFHKNFPKFASCRPIYVEDSIKDSGLSIVKKEEMLIGAVFPMKIIIAKL